MNNKIFCKYCKNPLIKEEFFHKECHSEVLKFTLNNIIDESKFSIILAIKGLKPWYRAFDYWNISYQLNREENKPPEKIIIAALVQLRNKGFLTSRKPLSNFPNQYSVTQTFIELLEVI